MMADELLNAQDLITAKKHDTFHSEVVTGKTGGLSTGANIDYTTNAVTGQVQKTLPATVNGIDWTPVGNLTTDNCTFTKSTDYAVDDNGTQWAYNGTFPFTSTAPVVPSEPDYYVVHVSSHAALSDLNPGSGLAHNADDIALQNGRTLQDFFKDSQDVRRNLTFKDAFIAWQNGIKFPVAFFGDSTYDGVGTTGHSDNVINTDHQPPHAFTTKLQELIRDDTGSIVARIYNAGFSGQTMQWGYENIGPIFGGVYSDVKMIGIGFGINDRLVSANTLGYEENFRAYTELAIKWCFDNNIQPFLLTTQAIMQPGTSFPQYPLRTSEAINSIANRVKKDLAIKYNLELIDLNAATEIFMSKSPLSLSLIINDSLHFNDAGHEFEAGYIFSKMCPRVIEFSGGVTPIGFESQNIVSPVAEGNLVYQSGITNLFKSLAYYDKANTTNETTQDFYVMNMTGESYLYQSVIQNTDSEFPLPAGEINRPRVVVNGVDYVSNNTFIDSYFAQYGLFMPQLVTNLRVGLSRIKADTGAYNRVSAGGFIVSDTSIASDEVETSFVFSGGIVYSDINEGFDGYLESEVRALVSMDTNCAAGESYAIAILNRKNSGVMLNFQHNFISLLKFSGSPESPSFTLVGSPYYFAEGVNSKEQMKSFYVTIKDGVINVGTDLKLPALISLDTGKDLGSFWCCDYIYPNYGTLIEGSYVKLKAKIL